MGIFEFYCILYYRCRISYTKLIHVHISFGGFTHTHFPNFVKKNSKNFNLAEISPHRRETPILACIGATTEPCCRRLAGRRAIAAVRGTTSRTRHAPCLASMTSTPDSATRSQRASRWWVRVIIGRVEIIYSI